ncbi:hypothetical protein NQ318_000811 [Aromia moschata]|uniref:HTH CENPB-type domain-containing protein n=1 Tax=Aromia moschata TaxID=1265417 RepID=A0AAV8X712_9CUCU|nr:hypothetical protein NQ318_000811 [Aromia moschata]
MKFYLPKAKQFYTETYGNDHFAASRSWISNFRKRHGLRSLKVCGEKLSNNQIAVDPVITVLAGKIKELDLTATQIYNADESALYWKMLPEKTLVNENGTYLSQRAFIDEGAIKTAITDVIKNHKSIGCVAAGEPANGGSGGLPHRHSSPVKRKYLD